MHKRSSYGTLLLGAFLVIMGVGFLLDSFLIIDFGIVISTFWPLFIITLAVTRFMVKDWKGGTIMGIIGIIAQLSALNLIHVNLWSLFWPLIFILVGFSILFKGIRKASKDTADDFISETTIFSGTDKDVTSGDFQGANLITMFGGTSIDTTHATYTKNGAVIDTLTLFGGTEIFVPNDTKVIMNVTALFGVSEDSRKEKPVSGKETSVLTVKGLVLFGGFEISNKKDQ